jgi:four helix bundle protein
VENKGFQRLQVWHEARAMSLAIYRLTKQFPRDETYNLVAQMRRASTSVMSNIAEGHGRHSRRDFAKFLFIARGSLMEVHSCLFLVSDLGYCTTEDVTKLEHSIEILGRMLNKLISTLVNPYEVREDAYELDDSFY